MGKRAHRKRRLMRSLRRLLIELLAERDYIYGAYNILSTEGHSVQPWEQMEPHEQAPWLMQAMQDARLIDLRGVD